MEDKRFMRTALKVSVRVLIVLLIVAFWVVVFVWRGTGIVFTGSTPMARDLLVSTLMETSAAKFIPRMYFSDDEIAEIMSANTVVTEDIPVSDGSGVTLTPTDETDTDKDLVEVVDVYGGTFKGKMMIVHDPSRVYVASPTAFRAPGGGVRVEDMVERDGAIGGVNAGGFEDNNGVGDGGTPLGIVIQNGELTYNSPAAVTTVIGIDKDYKLVVGTMSAQEALDRGVMEAVTFGPVGPLVVNGEAVEVSGTGGGLNPRTAIGQRADGAMLLLVVDGRQPHSLGATYSDLIDVMLDFEAVNAANLDGGSSSLMVYENEIITVCASLYGSRKIPTAFLVK